MVKSYDKCDENIKADVIILGCSLPGIVTAHKLKTKFGDTMDIVVLDLGRHSKMMSKCHVVFQEEDIEEDAETNYRTSKQLIDHVARHYLFKYAEEFSIPIPEPIFNTERPTSALHKLFQYRNGSTVNCHSDFNDYEYLGFIEKFELDQYHDMLDESLRNLFTANKVDTNSDRRTLRYYDQTTMEQNICEFLLFSTSREIMRTTVRLICGASPSSVSVLFYLHQCYRTNGSRNHIDRDNARLKEKLLSYWRKRIAHNLQQSIADITRPARVIKEIRTHSESEVILEMIGDNNYVCNLLAMALTPDQLLNIHVERQLLSESKLEILRAMKRGRAKKFLVQYEDNFWRADGYSGDILSVKGPILWATERPKIITRGSIETSSTLVGYLKVKENNDNDSKSLVLEQLVKFFGDKAAAPLVYKEKDITDVFVPSCGDYVDFRKWTGTESRMYLEWGALDVFGDGDVASALEAGHIAYVHLLRCLRPQAQTFEDIIRSKGQPTVMVEFPLKKWMVYFSCIKTLRLIAYSSALFIGFHLLRSLIRK